MGKFKERAYLRFEVEEDFKIFLVVGHATVDNFLPISYFHDATDTRVNTF